MASENITGVAGKLVRETGRRRPTQKCQSFGSNCVNLPTLRADRVLVIVFAEAVSFGVERRILRAETRKRHRVGRASGDLMLAPRRAQVFDDY